MLLIFPMWIFTYLNRERLRRLVQGVPLIVSFISFGLFFGLLIEVFAIFLAAQPLSKALVPGG